MITRAPMKRASRSTGPSSDVVTAILERAGYSCEGCLSPLGDRRGEDWSVHHRVPRGMGGTRWAGANRPPNLLILCGSGTTGCHGFAESHRGPAVAAGWLVQSRTDPRSVAVLIGGELWTYLGDDAEYAESPAVAS